MREDREAPLGGRRHLVDTSVYARTAHPIVARVWAGALREGLLVSSGPFVLEAVVSARDAAEAADLLEELTEGLPYVGVDEETWRLAYRAQQTMAAVGPQWHRRPPTDYLLSAAAHQHGLGVLHYDHDLEKIAQDGGLDFTHTWVAPPGTLETAHEQPQVVRLLKRAITARLAQFAGDDGEEAVHRDVLALLDEAIARTGKRPLPPP